MEGVKVVGIGGGEGRGNVGGICYVEVEEDWGDNRALGDASVDNFRRGIGVLIGTESHPATQVAGQPSDDVGMKVGGGDFLEKEVDGDAVKCFGKVDGGNSCAAGREVLIEAIGNGGGKVEEGGGGGVEGFKAVL